MPKPTERFTETVQNYLNYRPSYPPELLQLLINECGLTKNSIIADIGSGTGFLAKLFLDYGNSVFGVEPNEAMRLAGENYLKNYPNFHSIIGTAEATTLKNHSADFVTAGTAFHWFNVEKSKIEFTRIAKKDAWIVLVWNVRDMENSELVREYEELISTYGTDYLTTSASKFDKTAMAEFFAPNKMTTRSFKYVQHFDWAGFQGRLLSASYALRPGDEKYAEMMAKLKEIFDRYQKNGQIEFLYATRVHYGKVSNLLS